MPRMGKTEDDWNGLKLGFLKTVQPNIFQSLSLLFATSKIMLRRHICLESLTSWLISLLYFKFHSDLGWVIGKIKQNDLGCRDTASLSCWDFVILAFQSQFNFKTLWFTHWGRSHLPVDIIPLYLPFTVHVAGLTHLWIVFTVHFICLMSQH